MRDKLLAAERVKAIEWRDGKLGLLDQRVLPREETWLTYDSAAGVAEAIRSMVVRGAPAIGITAAYAVVLTRLPLVELFVISLTSAPATSAIAALVCAICP